MCTSRPVRAPPGTPTRGVRPSTGVGLVVTRAGEVLTLEPGRTVWIPPQEEHWHGAMAGTRMAHIAAQEADEDDETVTWLDPVTDEEFARAVEAAQQA